ncbi:hypothetical protein [uncultured Sulfitobacter sp.]|uniref:hypothetical protein n=1 Tax=uncultured Sulfitobacter sp. TaxID=191468 RepID=UPI00260D172F|nr:hypothetical protein [uncultured Sulfitobacter sp.]
MQRLFKETGVAAVIFAALSAVFGFGMTEGEGWQVLVLNTAIFAVFYFCVGLAIRYFKGRNS